MIVPAVSAPRTLHRPLSAPVICRAPAGAGGPPAPVTTRTVAFMSNSGKSGFLAAGGVTAPARNTAAGVSVVPTVLAIGARAAVASSPRAAVLAVGAGTPGVGATTAAALTALGSELLFGAAKAHLPNSAPMASFFPQRFTASVMVQRNCSVVLNFAPQFSPTNDCLLLGQPILRLFFRRPGPP